MKVSELIEKLQKLNPEHNVVVMGNEYTEDELDIFENVTEYREDHLVMIGDYDYEYIERKIQQRDQKTIDELTKDISHLRNEIRLMVIGREYYCSNNVDVGTVINDQISKYEKTIEKKVADIEVIKS